jgi:small subunit ribosomal protein S2
MEEKNKNNKDIMKEFLASGCHYGRAKRFTHPSMRIFLVKNNKKNIEVFDINKTIEKLNEAANYLSDAIKEKKTILFVGAKPAAEKPIQKIGEELNMPYMNYKWIGGFLTNFETIKTRLTYFKELLEKEKSGELENYPPQDKQRVLRELDKMKKIYGGAINLEKLPDIIFIVDLNFKSHRTAVREALKKEIPIVAICGSDNNVEKVKIVIPANDKAPRSISFLIDYLINKIKEKLQ